jgi:hypothetical protein
VTPHEVAALRLLAESEPAMRGRSDRMLAAAQVHATLAVAQATIAANRLRPGPTVSPR